MFEGKLTLAGSALAAVGFWAGVLAAPPSAAAPLVEFYVNGALQNSWTCADTEFDCTGKTDEFLAFVDTAGWTVTLTASLNPDPRIDYAATVIDHGAGNTFGFIFLQDIASVLAPGTATHDFSSSTTDGDFDGVPVNPAPPPAGIPQDAPGTNDEISVFTVSTNAGATWLNAGLDLGPAFVGASTGSDTQGPYGPVSASGPAGTGSYNKMRVDMNFTMTGGDDAYSPGGFAEIVVPEPMSLRFSKASSIVRASVPCGMRIVLRPDPGFRGKPWRKSSTGSLRSRVRRGDDPPHATISAASGALSPGPVKCSGSATRCVTYVTSDSRRGC